MTKVTDQTRAFGDTPVCARNTQCERTWTQATASNPLRVFSAARPSSADDGGFGPEETVGCVWWRESERGCPAWIDISGIYIFYRSRLPQRAYGAL